MPLDITFTLSDDDLKHFQEIVDKGQSAVSEGKGAEQIKAAAMKMVDEAQAADLPEFIGSRLLKLQILTNMVNDSEWKLSDEERLRVLGALAYFCDPEDLIPDHIPGIGFLDDAIYAEIILQELKAEIESYQEFCLFRDAEEERRRNKGLDPNVGREDWLADKRAVLHSRMRSRRRTRAGGGGWRMRLF